MRRKLTHENGKIKGFWSVYFLLSAAWTHKIRATNIVEFNLNWEQYSELLVPNVGWNLFFVAN